MFLFFFFFYPFAPFSSHYSEYVIDYEIGSGHQSPGLWRHPEDESHRFNDVDHWIELAQLLESAKFHGIFIADVLGMHFLLFGKKVFLGSAC